MRVAFYAPLKAPDHVRPSGDRLIGRMLVAALERHGHHVEIASRFRSLDLTGNTRRQARLRRYGEWQAAKLVRHCLAVPLVQRPQVWLTYHLYAKAPDWLGPTVSAALGIPYVVVEASVSPKQADGPHASGHKAVIEALGHARLVLSINPKDEAGVLPHLRGAGRHERLAPFIDGTLFRQARENHSAHRIALASAYDLDLDLDLPWLITVAMMRPGDKLASYRLLVETLERLLPKPWQLLVIGDGEARPQIEALMARVQPGVVFLGERSRPEIAQALGASDVFIWPAINEAIGMALIEAQAAGLPVIAADRPGIAAVVVNGRTGVLCEEGKSFPLADAFNKFIVKGPQSIAAMGKRASTHARRHHDITTTGAAFAAKLEALIR
jgi:glycosyltransferase involved in cell wall biosynthesis